MSHVGSPLAMQAWLSAALRDVGDRSEGNECGSEPLTGLPVSRIDRDRRRRTVPSCDVAARLSLAIFGAQKTDLRNAKRPPAWPAGASVALLEFPNDAESRISQPDDVGETAT